MTIIHVDRVRRCDFCLKTETQVDLMIAGEHADICRDCVAVCVEIIGKHYADQLKRQRAPTPEPTPAEH